LIIGIAALLKARANTVVQRSTRSDELLRTDGMVLSSGCASGAPLRELLRLEGGHVVAGEIEAAVHVTGVEYDVGLRRQLTIREVIMVGEDDS
jgi:hypothetical protein